jgi:hypothetical protein
MYVAYFGFRPPNSGPGTINAGAGYKNRPGINIFQSGEIFVRSSCVCKCLLTVVRRIKGFEALNRSLFALYFVCKAITPRFWTTEYSRVLHFLSKG